MTGKDYLGEKIEKCGCNKSCSSNTTPDFLIYLINQLSTKGKLRYFNKTSKISIIDLGLNESEVENLIFGISPGENFFLSLQFGILNEDGKFKAFNNNLLSIINKIIRYKLLAKANCIFKKRNERLKIDKNTKIAETINIRLGDVFKVSEIDDIVNILRTSYSETESRCIENYTPNTYGIPKYVNRINADSNIGDSNTSSSCTGLTPNGGDDCRDSCCCPVCT